MRSSKQQRLRKRILTIVVIIIIAAMAFAYIIPLTAMPVYAAPATPPPPDIGMGTDDDFDDSTLPMPWDDDDDDDVPQPDLRILGGPITLDVDQSIMIQFTMENFPSGTFPDWRSSNPNVAVVGSSGELLAIAPGTAEIVVVAGDLRSSVFVTVNDLKAKSITIVVGSDVTRTGNNAFEIKTTDVLRFSATIEPKGAKVEKITWELGDDTVAKIVPNGQVCEFTPIGVGHTQVIVSAGSLSDAIYIDIIESGTPTSKIWEVLRLVLVVVVVIVVIAIALNLQKQKREKEKARQRALAKRRREEAERRARAEAEAEHQRDMREPRAQQTEERGTMKVTGTVVGAGVPPPPEPSKPTEPERPVTLDDLK